MSRICFGCGAKSEDNDRVCRICGKLLSEEYQPLDSLRSSYRLHGKQLLSEADKIENLFEQNKNSASETAFACFVYSLVPYLGILFVPLALIAGSYGLIFSSLHPNLGGRRLSAWSLVLSLFVLLIQLFLWWLLYLIPEISKL